MVRWVTITAVLSGTIALAACASSGPNRSAGAKRGPVCETADGNATSFGLATSRLYAETALKFQAAEIRGELLRAGLRRIQVSRPVSQCQPAPGAFRGMGLTRCRSYAQVCGQ
jgi:hypothetical protein